MKNKNKNNNKNNKKKNKRRRGIRRKEEVEKPMPGLGMLLLLLLLLLLLCCWPRFCFRFCVYPMAGMMPTFPTQHTQVSLEDQQKIAGRTRVC